MIYRIFMIVLIFTIGTVSFVNAQSRDKQLTSMSNDGANITWTVLAPNAGGTLTISTPAGEVIRQEFKGGSAPMFTSRDRLAGGDGQYKYEIVLTPNIPADVRAALTAARAEGRADEVYENFVRAGVIPPRMVETGAFKVLNGLIYTADSGAEPGEPKQAAERTPPIDTDQKNPGGNVNRGDVPPENVQVINDDLVVQGSQCLGFDCPAAPAFGFDTFRLQENNLRIHFDDTSNTASFPSNDWRIVANDTTNGGASYLAFEDSTAGNQPFRVEAGAGNAALWVTDSGGNVGMGTATPVVELHIADGDTPTIRLEQNNSSGFTPQTWDVAGNEANFFIRDTTNGSRLPFKIRPGANNDSLVISNTSNVGMGVGISPSEKLDVGGNVQADGDFIIKFGSTGRIVFADGTTQSTAGGGGGGGEVNTAANVGSGVGIFKQKVGAQLQFKSLTAGANVTITPSGADSVEIAAGAPSPLGPAFATTIFGGSGTVVPPSTVTPTIDANNFGAGITGAGNFAIMLYNVPGNSNLADPAGAMTTFKIRYRDSDGTTAGARVSVNLVTINVAAGNQTVNPIFDSNTNAGTGFQTVTVCKPSTFFNFNTLGNHLNITLVSSAGTNADIIMVQMYKSATCP